MHLSPHMSAIPGPQAGLQGQAPAHAPLKVVLHGMGPRSLGLLRLLGSARPELATMRLVAVVTQDVGLVKDAASLGVSSYPSLEELASALPGVDVVLGLDDVTEDAPSAAVRRLFGPGTRFLEQDSADFLISLLGAGHMDDCTAALDGARSFLATILDHLSDDVLLLDLDGIIVDCNRNVLQRTGLSKAAIVGRHFSAVMPEDDNLCRSNGEDCPFDKVLGTGERTEAMYSRVDGKGRLQYIRVYTYPIFDSSGVLTHVAELRRDITQRTEMEQRLKQSQKLAAIGELSTFLAHEIRNPLFSISGFANSLLRQPGLDTSARGKVEIILAESRRLDEILKSILNFARPMEDKGGEVNLSEVVVETMGVLAIGCEAQNITVKVEAAGDLPTARGDHDLIKQCLINLVKNSVEAMPEGGKLSVRTGLNTSPGHSGVFLSVEDSGGGIPEENRELVFSPFFSTKEKGSGLGLAMIKKIIEDLGGEVLLQSITGRGTQVTMSLPPVLAVDER